jgi:hypothetical protein
LGGKVWGGTGSLFPYQGFELFLEPPFWRCRVFILPVFGNVPRLDMNRIKRLYGCFTRCGNNSLRKVSLQKHGGDKHRSIYVAAPVPAVTADKLSLTE